MMKYRILSLGLLAGTAALATGWYFVDRYQIAKTLQVIDVQSFELKERLEAVVTMRQEGGVEAVKQILARFPHRAIAGPVTVYSDISLKFSKEHAKHGKKTWAYFSKVFAKTPGDKLVLYYTHDEKIYSEIALHTDFPKPMQNARMVTSLWNKDHRLWFIVPYEKPDYGTQLHEISHDFLYANYPASAEYPWIKEGTGMYWESGHWDENGNLVVGSAIGDYLRDFKTLNQNNKLLSLKKLVTLHCDKFWHQPMGKTYGQSMVLIHYLMKQHPVAMKRLFERLNKGEIKSNERLLQVLQSELSIDMETLEMKYVEFGLEILD